MNILVINDYNQQYSPFWSHLCQDQDHVTDDPEILFRAPKSVELVCFTGGGSDISPRLYEHRDLGYSTTNPARDQAEVLFFQQAEKERIPVTGIGRGAQFLNVMCGGTLVQHLDGHHALGMRDVHAVQTIFTPIDIPGEEYAMGGEYTFEGCHSQMMVPGSEGVVLAWAKEPALLSDCAYDGNLGETGVLQPVGSPDEVLITEVVAYPGHRALLIQAHPENQPIEDDAPQWVLEMTRRICLGQGARVYLGDMEACA